MFRLTVRTLFNITSRRAFSSTPKAQDVAKLTLCGHIATDPETVTSPSGTTFLKYSIATGFGRGEARRTSFWRVAVFDEKQKEICASLSKGATVFVDADIECKPYEDEAGKKHTYINLYQRSINVIYRGRNAPPMEEGILEETQTEV